MFGCEVQSDKRNRYHSNQQLWLRKLTGLITVLGLGSGLGSGLGWLGNQPAIAQTETSAAQILPLALIETVGSPVLVRTIPGYPPRFSEVAGSGSLLLNDQNEVTGYYFTVAGLEPGAAYAYHFHAAMNNSTPTSCEGDKALFRGEAGGSVITNLGAIAPIEVNSSGVARVGSSLNPVAIADPVPLSEIGYLNIHPAPDGAVGPGIVCANVRLNPGGFVR